MVFFQSSLLWHWFEPLEHVYNSTCTFASTDLVTHFFPAYNAGMDTDTLTTFVEVVRRGSFAAVARERAVDATTVSRAIAGLERELDLRLFQRTTRQLRLTEAGAIYFERVEPLVDELQKARLAAGDVDAQPRGVLRVSCPVSFAQLNLLPLLPAFARQYPEIHFDLVLTDVLVDLITEQLDVAIRVGPLYDSTLIAHKLCPYVARVCATPGYLRTHGRPRSPAELA
jgi:DNA-binding transcriptional LysR family regulator